MLRPQPPLHVCAHADRRTDSPSKSRDSDWELSDQPHDTPKLKPTRQTQTQTQLLTTNHEHRSKGPNQTCNQQSPGHHCDRQGFSTFIDQILFGSRNRAAQNPTQPNLNPTQPNPTTVKLSSGRGDSEPCCTRPPGVVDHLVKNGTRHNFDLNARV